MSENTNPRDYALLERRRNVAQRYIRGASQWEIARAFEVSQSTISKDLKFIHNEWLGAAVQERGSWIAQQLAKIDECERQAWIGWAKSQENAETMRAKMRGDQTETEKTSRGQEGDPRFLDIIMRCVQRRCELLGLDEAVSGATTVVTVVGGVDLDVILGRKAGLVTERTIIDNGERPTS